MTYINDIIKDKLERTSSLETVLNTLRDHGVDTQLLLYRALIPHKYNEKEIDYNERIKEVIKEAEKQKTTLPPPKKNEESVIDVVTAALKERPNEISEAIKNAGKIK